MTTRKECFQISLGTAVIAVLMLLVFLGEAKGEVRPFVGAGLQTSANGGYINPILYGNAGLELKKEYLLVNTLGQYSWARKIETGNGHGYKVLAEAYGLTSKGIMLGGGASWQIQCTSAWNKSSSGPFIGGGWDGNSARVLVTYQFWDSNKRNDSKTVALRMEFKPSPHWHPMIDWNLNRFHYTDVPAWKRTSSSITLGVKYAF